MENKTISVQKFSKAFQIATVNQAKMSLECLFIQVWGIDYCKTCEYRDTLDCGGKNILKTGKNEKGFVVPIGK